MRAPRSHALLVLSAVALSGAWGTAARGAPVDAEHPSVAGAVLVPCAMSTGADATRRRVHVGALDVHASLGGGDGRPVHVGIGLSLRPREKRRDDADHASVFGARGTACGAKAALREILPEMR